MEVPSNQCHLLILIINLNNNLMFHRDILNQLDLIQRPLKLATNQNTGITSIVRASDQAACAMKKTQERRGKPRKTNHISQLVDMKLLQTKEVSLRLLLILKHNLDHKLILLDP